MNHQPNQANIDWNVVLQTAIGLENQGRFAEALKGYEILAKHCSKQPAVQNNYGSLLLRMGDYDRAIRAFEKSLVVDKKQAEIYFMLAIAMHEKGLYGKAVLNYNQAIKLQADFADAYLNRGVSLYQLKRHDEAIASYDKALSINSNLEDAYFNKAIVLQDIKQYDSALLNYKLAIELKPDYAEAYYNVGNTLYALKNYEQAVIDFKKAIELKPDYIDAYYNFANCHYQLKNYRQGIEIADRIIAINPKYAYGYLMKGMCLEKLHNFDQAIACFDAALALDDKLAEAYASRGVTLLRQKRFEEARSSYEKAIAQDKSLVNAWRGLGNVYREQKCYDLAIQVYSDALKREPEMDYLAGDLFFVRMQVCDWAGYSQQCDALIDGVKRHKMAISPFPLMALVDMPDLHYRAAKIFADSALPSTPTLPAIQHYAGHSKIRIAYFSADFYGHPSMHLMAELLELHDRDRFEVIGFSFTHKTDDEWQIRAINAFDRYYDIRMMNDVEVAALARSLEIDIAIDVNGYTRGCRPGIFYERAAPIQIGFLGYPGTTAGSFNDYVVADNTIICEENAKFFSEAIIRLPNYYAPTCSDAKISPHQSNRSAFGLPENRFVFCSFNANYKISPDMFACWMRILQGVEGSVLWLYLDNQHAKHNLIKEAEARGVSGDRLIFTENLPLNQHLKRLQLADLMLDTFPYNAHTTGSDALRMGLPLLTLKGRSFASRVAASLLTTVELPELVVTSLEAYEAKAIAIANEPRALADLKRRLIANLESSPLFDSRQYTMALETLLLEISGYPKPSN